MKAENPSRPDSHTAKRVRPEGPSRPYEAPRFELICLACEISAYAPDEDGPLF